MNQDPGQEQRIFMAVALSIAIYLGWAVLFPPPLPVDAVEAPGSPVTAETAEQPVPALVVPTPAVVPEAPAQVVPERSASMDLSDFTAVVESRDGALQQVILRDYKTAWKVMPLWSWAWKKIKGQGEPWVPYDRDDTLEQIVGTSGSLVLAGAGRPSEDGQYLIEESEDGVIARSNKDGVRIEKRYTSAPGPHVMNVEVRFENQSNQAISTLWVGVAQQMDTEAGRFLNVLQPLGHTGGSLEKLDDPEDALSPEVLDGPVDWLGLGNRYFVAALAPREGTTSNLEFEELADGRVGAFMVDHTALAAGDVRTYSFLAYAGPKDLELLTPLGSELDQAVEFGFFGFFSKILLLLLKMFQKGVANWGLSIILLTVLVKLAFFPLTQKAYVSGKRMQAIQPKLTELKEKYKDNPQLQTQETMKLFQENKVNPMGGCLPSLIQLPVWFALYSVLLNSVELYDSTFLYLKDLTEVDPFGFLPLVVAVLQILQFRMMPMQSMDPAQQQVMKLMPIMFAFFMFTFPSGLALYIAVNYTLGIAQQWHINRSFKTSEQPAVA